MRPRSEQVDSTVESTYHCWSRVVRRAFLLSAEVGDTFGRKPWLEERLKELSFIFAIDVDAFAIMDNHLHLVLSLRPQLVASWSNDEVARRWLLLFPPVERVGERREATLEDIAFLAADTSRIERLRSRLCDLGEYHKALKEPLARRVNREEGVTGHFWEGRYKSRRVLDKEALLMSVVYVDLNPIRAKLAETPEESVFTSVWHRSRAWKRAQRGRVRRRSRWRKRRIGEGERPARVKLEPEPTPSFLTPVLEANGRRGLFSHITLEQYLTLVDRLGRVARSGKPGRIASELAPILDRLGLDAGRVIEEALCAARWFGSVLGKRESCSAEAARSDRIRVITALRLDGE